MGIVSLLSTIIYVATLFTMFLAVFSYTAFKLRERQRKRKPKRTESGLRTSRPNRLLRVYLIEGVELVGTLKWYDKLGMRMTLGDGREVTVCKTAVLYYEELNQPLGLLDEELKNEVESTARNGT